MTTEPAEATVPPPATFEFIIFDTRQDNYTNKKCSDCKVVTVHMWNKVSPGVTPHAPSGLHVEATDLLKLTKRLAMCTCCGKLSLTN